MLTITDIQEKLKLILEENQLKHSFYDESVKIANEINETFGDHYPAFLNLERPKEAKKDKEYRKSVFKNPVKGHLSRILDKLIKVEQSEDFLVNYPLDDSGINLLRDYCENNFNGSNSLVNWLFTIGVNAYAKTPNAVIAVLDINPPQTQTDSYKPYPKIFLESDVLDFVKNQYCVLRQILSQDETSYFFIDEISYWIVNHSTLGNREKLQVTGPIQHYCGVMPALKLGRHIEKTDSSENVLFKSLLSDSLPDFKKAISRSSDIEIELNHHVHTLEWQMSPKKCPTCNGRKTIPTLESPNAKCKTCDGHGTLSWGNLDVLLIDTYEDNFIKDQSKFPFNSPGGFIPRNIAAVQELTKAYYNHVDDAYDAIDFGILRKKDLNSAESGLSKQYNRLEFSQRIYSEGRHLIENILIPIYKFIDAQLFGINAENQKFVRIPEITIPISFDVMSPEMVLSEIKTAKDSGMSAEIVKSLELKYCKLVFGDNSKETKNIIDEISLNPTLGMSVSDVISLFGGGAGTSTNGLSKTYYIIGANFKAFIDRAIREEMKWESMEAVEKWNILVKYANELISQRPQMPTLPVVEVI